MGSMKEYFLCDNCQGRDFVRLYSFSVSFRRVNFSDDLVHDEVKEEIYRCTQCHISRSPGLVSEVDL
jgi:nitrate reductase cytochrome c-type subunit